MKSRLEAINTEAQDENRKEKLCLIEDITKLKKLLYGMGETHHNEFLNEDKAAELWLKLYDMDMTQLTLINKSYEKRYNAIVLSKMGALV